MTDHHDLCEYLKAFGTLEGVIRVLDPEVSLMEVASPFAQHYFLTHLDVEDTLKQSGLDLLEGMKAAPKIAWTSREDPTINAAKIIPKTSRLIILSILLNNLSCFFNSKLTFPCPEVHISNR